MKLLKNIFCIMGFIFLLILLVINILSFISIYFFHNTYPNLLGYTYFEVKSGSMVPSLEIGDLVIVKLTKEAEIGDIITYQEENHYITHRVMEIKDKITTKGDANAASDEPINQENIVGKVIKVIPNIGKIRYTITSPYFLIVLILSMIIYKHYSSKGKEKMA